MTNWFIAAALVLILELFSGTIYLLIISIALFGAGIAALLFPDSSAGIITATVLAAAGIVWVRRRIKLRRACSKNTDTDDLDSGQTVHIHRHLHTDTYEVHYRGTIWQAKADNIKTDSQPQTAVITGKNGNTLLIHLH